MKKKLYIIGMLLIVLSATFYCFAGSHEDTITVAEDVLSGVQGSHLFLPVLTGECLLPTSLFQRRMV